MGLYHSEVYMPKLLQQPCFEGRLRYSRHAIDEANSDRYGDITPPPYFYVEGKEKLIEVETDSKTGKVVKQVWRQALDDERDIVLVITADGNVKTLWVNLKTDKHKTLDRSRYIKPRP